ncbi:solute carrier family 15 member 4-like [Lineus longissimus]|uniref:solute carrier family 15 member 4-like n=1 Tax=Lineus longissimus TaxID=88925 RepID=UPI002B4F204F
MAEERRPLIVRQDTRCDQRSRTTKQWAGAAILGTVTLERIAFYGVTGNLVLFLNKDPFSWMSYNASNALFVFMGLSFVLCLFEGWLADAFLGRFKTIFIFFFVYLGGYILLPLLFPYPFKRNGEDTELPQMCSSVTYNTSNGTSFMSLAQHSLSILVQNWTVVITGDTPNRVSPGDEACAPFVYLSLVLMAIGTAAIRTNIAPFGGDQMKSEGPQASRGFFNWFYWSVNIGSFIALGPIAYLQQEVSFFWGYLVPGICLFLAMIVFCAGCKFYLVKPQSGSVISSIFNVIWEACSMKRKQNKRHQQYRTIDTAGSSSEAQPQGLLDYAKSRYGGSFHDNDVEEVRSLGKTVLIFVTMIPYWIGYYQMETTFLMQGLHMRLSPERAYFDDDRIGNITSIPVNRTGNSTSVKQFQIPAAWLSLFDVIVVIILIPIMNRLIYPKLDRMNRPLLLKNRIAIGMAVSVLAIICAGVVENQRLAIFWKNGTEHPVPQVVGNTTFYAADMAIAWQIPQYALIGISEVFTSIGGLELAYSLSPKSMQGLIMGLFYFMSGIGSFLGTAIMYIFQGIWFFTWDRGDINCRFLCSWDTDKICAECRMDYYFFVLAGVEVFGLILYLLLTWKCRLGQDLGRKRVIQDDSINQSTPASLSVPSDDVGDCKPEGRNGSVKRQSTKGYTMNYTA